VRYGPRGKVDKGGAGDCEMVLLSKILSCFIVLGLRSLVVVLSIPAYVGST
jgi:hypothetical protein